MFDWQSDNDRSWRLTFPNILEKRNSNWKLPLLVVQFGARIYFSYPMRYEFGKLTVQFHVNCFLVSITPPQCQPGDKANQPYHKTRCHDPTQRRRKLRKLRIRIFRLNSTLKLLLRRIVMNVVFLLVRSYIVLRRILLLIVLF